MNEVKSPKKPLVYYYAIVILVILALNFLAVPWLSQRQVKEVDYGTFMTMTENQEIGRVEVQNNQILFTNKDDTQVYKQFVENESFRRFVGDMVFALTQERQGDGLRAG